MAMVAVLAPPEVGEKRTVKVVVPPPEATGEVGWAWILKSPASAPPMVLGVVNVKLAVPEFVMVNTASVSEPSTWLPKP